MAEEIMAESEVSSMAESEGSMVEEIFNNEFENLVERYDMELPQNYENDKIFRALCARQASEKLKKLTTFLVKVQQELLKKPNVRNLCEWHVKSYETEFFDDNEWHQYPIYEILDFCEFSIDEPLKAVAFMTYNIISILDQGPNILMKGDIIYVNNSAKPTMDMFIKTHQKVEVSEEQKAVENELIMENFYIPGLSSWISAGRHGVIIHNHVIQTYALDGMPDFCDNFQSWQICFLSMIVIFGNDDCFVVTEFFTLIDEEKWNTAHEFLSLEPITRMRLTEEYISNRINSITYECISSSILQQFEYINVYREKLKKEFENIGEKFEEFSDVIKPYISSKETNTKKKIEEKVNVPEVKRSIRKKRTNRI